MMRLAATIAVALAMVACGSLPVRAPVRPGVGIAFATYRAPMTVDFNETKVGAKHGTATVLYVHEPLLTNFAIAWGDASLKTAAEEGDISKVSFADYEVLNVLGIFVRFTTHAYGE